MTAFRGALDEGTPWYVATSGGGGPRRSHVDDDRSVAAQSPRSTQTLSVLSLHDLLEVVQKMLVSFL